MTPGAFQRNSGGQGESFVAKFDLSGGGATAASVSAASYRGAELAPEAICAAFGARLATATQAATQTPLPETLAGTTVRVLDSAGAARPAPLFFAAPAQVNYLLPAGLALGDATIMIANGDNVISSGPVRLTRVAPGIFTANASGQGVAAAVVQRVSADGTTSFESVARLDAAGRYVAVPLEFGPAGERLFLLLFGTGWRNRTALSAVTARLGALDVPPGFAGAVPQLAGLDQLNLELPRALAGRGEVEINVTVDGKAANPVRVAFR